MCIKKRKKFIKKRENLLYVVFLAAFVDVGQYLGQYSNLFHQMSRQRLLLSSFRSVLATVPHSQERCSQVGRYWCRTGVLINLNP